MNTPPSEPEDNQNNEKDETELDDHSPIRHGYEKSHVKNNISQVQCRLRKNTSFNTSGATPLNDSYP